jgi:O-acetylhomoserine/O-acetylserine sulfhydrylase-like pyridoxal-dependent enzyme
LAGEKFGRGGGAEPGTAAARPQRGQGLFPEFVPLSIGTEDKTDLIADLKQALDRL